MYTVYAFLREKEGACVRVLAHLRGLLHQTAWKCNKPIRTRAKKSCNGWKAREMTRDKPVITIGFTNLIG